MGTSVGKFVYRGQRLKLALGLSGAIAAAAAASGCSADVARFDFPGFSLTDKSGSTGTLQPSEPMRAGSKSLIGGQQGEAYVPPRSGRDSNVQMSALPDATPAPAPAPPPPTLRAAQPAPMAAAPAPAPAAAGGQTITVVAGDTLFGLSKRHGVPVSELMSVNNLTNANLKPGQQLVLPASGNGKRMVKRPDATAPIAAAPAASVRQTASNWDGSYTIKPGDSLYGLARQYKVTQAELQQVNNINDPRKVRPGTIIKVPLAGGALPPAAVAEARPDAPSAAATPAPAATEPVTSAPRVVQSTTQPTIINGEKKVAALTDKATDATPSTDAVEPSAKGEQVANAAGSAASGSGKLRWPVKGKIIAGFGPRADGTHNDGVNIAVPQGAEVHAAEAGTVAYAGSELKGYGNLILLRHDNGMVTAYAHNEELLVKRGDKVRRGHVIAKAGKTGQVDQPQVHFEVRQGSKPVDPTPFLEKM